MLPLNHRLAPRFWRNETGGKLQPAIERYLRNEPEKPDDIAWIRAYLRQWIDSPVWDQNPTMTRESRLELALLRTRAAILRTRAEIGEWLRLALDAGIDPL